VPVGADESENVERRREGFDDLREVPDNVEPHYDLGEELEILDFERGAKVAGGGFYVAKGDGARLEHALIQFMLDVHREQDYRDVFPPIAVNSTSMRGTGQLPKFTEDAYRIEGTNEDAYDDDDLWLLPTAEVPVTNLHRDEILLGEDLPLKYQAYTPNFRQEAGEHGTETRGIVRVHQFNKVEMVNFVRPEESHERFEGLVDEAEEVLRRLELPYRILEMCTGDLGFTQAKKYDLEVWAPADDMDEGPAEGGRWLEVSRLELRGIPGAPCRDPVPRGAPRVRGVPPHPERFGARRPADRRRDLGVLPERRRHRHRPRGAAPVHGRHRGDRGSRRGRRDEARRGVDGSESPSGG